MATKPLSKWNTRKAGKKPIGASPLPDQSDGKRVNNFDTAGPPAIWNPMRESDPNALGPVMRAPYDACARAASHCADMHDSYEKPYPRVQRGAVATGLGSSDERKDGPDGSW